MTNPSFPYTYTGCRLCPRMCGVDRTCKKGFCQSGPQPMIARAALHHWEEPSISGTRGSGTIFFSGCTLRCCFCQNYKISHEGFGKEVTPQVLSELFLKLQNQGAHNINLVTATHYLPSVTEALNLARPSLSIPVVYNCGGYERASVIKALKPYIDTYQKIIRILGEDVIAGGGEDTVKGNCAARIQEILMDSTEEQALFMTGLLEYVAKNIRLAL